MSTNKIIQYSKKLSLPVLIFTLATSSYLHFGNTSQYITQELDKLSGKVAGTQTKKKVKNITNEIPIMPDAKIVSVDTTDHKITTTLEVAINREKEIKPYYDDFTFLNNWKEIRKNTYQKENKTLSIEITENIVKLTLEKTQ